MHDDRELACEGDLGCLRTASFRDPHRPRAKRRPASVVQQDVRRLIKSRANHLVAAPADVPVVVCLAGAVSPRRQPEVGTNIPLSREALGDVNASPVGERDHHSHTWNRHQPAADRIFPSQLPCEAIELGELLKERPTDTQHRFRDRQQTRRVPDKLEDPRFE